MASNRTENPSIPTVQNTTTTKTETKKEEKPINTTPTPPAVNGSYKDINSNHRSYNAIIYLTKKGILKGYNDNTF